MQLNDKLHEHQTHISAINFDDVADAADDLKSRWQQLMQFEEKFTVG